VRVEAIPAQSTVEERLIRMRLAAMQRRHCEELQPLIDRLAALEAKKLPSFVVWLDPGEAEALAQRGFAR
jgi:hypothetical protein